MPFAPGMSEFVLQGARHMSRLDNYMRIVDLRRMAHISCGATQESIESHTFPHKYKRVRIEILKPFDIVIFALFKQFITIHYVSIYR